MADDEVRNPESESSEAKRPRRDLLRIGLAAVAGLASGYSVLASQVKLAQVTPKAVTVRIPPLKFSGAAGRRALAAESRRQVLDSVAPVVTEIVEQSGAKLDSAQMAKLREMLLSKGSIKLPDPSSAAGYNLELTISGGLPAPGRLVRPGD